MQWHSCTERRAAVTTQATPEVECVVDCADAAHILGRAVARARYSAGDRIKRELFTHLALAHGHAWAVPEALCSLGLLVIVMPAGAQRRAQSILVLSKARNDHCCHRLVHAEVGPAPAAAKA